MKNKTILITGGTGTLGQALVEKLIPLQPKKIIIFSRDEYKQFIMREKYKSPCRYFIGDVRDADRLKRAFENVDIVIHAAALKHVETGEYNPLEVIKTNVNGAQNVIDAAIHCKVGKVLMVSSDKAVNPTNLYGATKLCADKLALGAAVYTSDVKFACIRPGNFWGSRGSVVEKFKKIYESGKWVFPVTSFGMTRFFIPPDRAAELIIEVVQLMHGGEIYLPKMECVKISDIPKALTEFAEYEIIGVGKGEKLFEEMLVACDTDDTYELDNFYVTCNRKINSKKVDKNFRYTSENGPWVDVKKLL